MIKVEVRTNGPKRFVTTDVTSTPKAVLDELGIASCNAVYMRGVTLNKAMMAQSFQELGVNDGDEVIINSLVKADGGRN